MGENNLQTCDWCLSDFEPQRPNQRFCPGGECRRAWHRYHGRHQGTPGTAEYVRPRAHGRLSITVHLSREQAARFRHLSPGDPVLISEPDGEFWCTHVDTQGKP